MLKIKQLAWVKKLIKASLRAEYVIILQFFYQEIRAHLEISIEKNQKHRRGRFAKEQPEASQRGHSISARFDFEIQFIYQLCLNSRLKMLYVVRRISRRRVRSWSRRTPLCRLLVKSRSRTSTSPPRTESKSTVGCTDWEDRARLWCLLFSETALASCSAYWPTSW